MLQKQIEEAVADCTSKIMMLVHQNIMNNMTEVLGRTSKKGKSQRKVRNVVPPKKTRTAKVAKMTKAQQKVFDVLANGKPLTTLAISKKVGVSISTTLYHLNALGKAKVVKRMKDGRKLYFQLR